MLADIRPNEEHAKEIIERNPVTTLVQCVPELSEHEVNTNAVIFTNKAMSHVEGGWPKDIDYTEAEHTIRSVDLLFKIYTVITILTIYNTIIKLDIIRKWKEMNYTLNQYQK